MAENLHFGPVPALPDYFIYIFFLRFL